MKMLKYLFYFIGFDVVLCNVGNIPLVPFKLNFSHSILPIVISVNKANNLTDFSIDTLINFNIKGRYVKPSGTIFRDSQR